MAASVEFFEKRPGEKLSVPRERPILSAAGMKLRDVLAGAGAGAGAAEPLSRPETEISSIAYNSRQASPGSMFVAIRGEVTDGNRFVFDAIERGASVIASELPPPPSSEWDAMAAPFTQQVTQQAIPPSVEWVRVADARKALASVSANFFGRPADKLEIVGITGTNGKTTTSFLIDSIVRAAGRRTGLFGTIEYRTPAEIRTATTTTPESLDLQRFLAEIVHEGGTNAVLEASSHALILDRLWGCRFAAAVFTNLTRDHLDFHRTMEDYFAAKRRLFEGTGTGAPAVGIVNVDDPLLRPRLWLLLQKALWPRGDCGFQP